MSLHNQSYLASSHQADMHRQAAEHRLVAKERRITVAPVTDANGPTPSPVRRIAISLAAALRPIRRQDLTPRA